MKNKWIFVLIGIIVIAGIAAFFLFSQNNSNNTPYMASDGQRISTEVENKSQNTSNPQNSQNTQDSKKLVETEISKFSTKILVEDDNRDNNLELSASKINGVVVKKGEEFSFNDTVGNPSPDEGYEKAGIFIGGKKSKGYGGGNCQISTTLYDAVLKVKGLEVTERHEHGKEVGYVEKGKDATVVYDELDLKFKNNTGYDIKIYSDVTEEKVNVKIVKLSYES